jgi:glycine dehydrogenase subunit 2
MEGFLREITGMDAVSLQPAAGAQGELTGIMLINAYHRNRGDCRTRFIIPDTAHGTNPASAALCGFSPVALNSNERGVIAPETVEKLMDDDVAGIMVTNPNTLGLFEENIRDVAEIVHSRGGLVYCDGANLNAVMGIVQMGALGVDVMHVNLHKTFSTPHGGGGPGSGPVCVKKHLEPFLPVPRIIEEQGRFSLSYRYPLTLGKVHSFYGNAGVIIRAYSYLLSMGPEELRNASRYAVLNANYIRASLRDTFHLPYDRPCMHECVFTDKNQQEYHVTTLDIAKRLIDYGFHPPTIYFPLVVRDAIMIEPTETESKETLDMFIDACKSIAREAAELPELLYNAPSRSKVKRLDEVRAARNLCIMG